MAGLVDECRDATIRPRQIVYACGDAGVQMQRITWQRWTDHRAVGRAARIAVKRGCCAKPRVIEGAKLVAFDPRPFDATTSAFACLRVRPGLTAGRTVQVLNLVYGTWDFSRTPYPRRVSRSCPGE